MPVNPTSYFFAIEQDIRRPIAGTMTFDEGHGVRPHGTLSRLGSDAGYENSAILASDVGYCTQPTDPNGPVPYPPRVQEAFAIDALVNLDPGQSAVGANWGAIKLANNDDKFDQYITGGWIADGQHTRIFYGLKTLESFPGRRTSRTGAATWINSTNTIQLAAAGAVRQDYSGAITIDQLATNSVRNSIAAGAVAGTIGSGGVVPTGWSISAAGLAIELSTFRTAVAGGTASVVRLRFHGVTTATNGMIYYATAGGVSGILNAQSITQSHYVALVAGSFANVTAVNHWLAAADRAAAAVGVPVANFMSSITTTLTQFSRTFVFPATGAAPYTTANAAVQLTWGVGAAIDVTLDIVAPQVEFGTTATPFIATSAGEVTHGDGTTNFIAHSDMSGGVAGSPGTLPTGWYIEFGGGVSQQVVAVGTDSVTGLKYLDLRLFGTTTSPLTKVHFSPWNIIDANQGQSWCFSAYAQLVAGSQTGVSFQFGCQEMNAAGTYLALSGETAKQLSVNVVSKSRRIAPFITANADTRFLMPSLWITYTSGVALDLTIRLMAPQLEGGATATAFVPASTGPAGRAPTYTVTGQPAVLNEPDATNYVLVGQSPGAGNVTVTSTTEVPAMYVGTPVWKHVRTVTGADTNFGAIGVGGLPTNGPVLTGSAWVWIRASLSTAKTAITVSIEGNVSGATSVPADLSKRDQWQLVTATATLNAGASATNAVLRISPQLAGDVLYSTAGQLELGPVATSYIAVAAAPSTRSADLLYGARNIFLDPPYASLVPAFHGVAGIVTSDDTEFVISLRDASYWLERALLRSTYGGTGQYDGGPELTGTLKPLVIGGSQVGTTGSSWFGAISNVTPVLIDPVNLIYQVSDGPIGRIAALYEGGAPGQWPNAGDVQNLYDGVGAPSGRFRTCLARGCIQLGTQPVYQITVDVNGPSLAPLTSTCLAVAVDVLVGLCGVPKDLVAVATGTNAGELATIGAVTPIRSGCGVFLGPQDNPSGVDLMTRILAPAGMKLVACRDGLLRALVIAAIPASPTLKAQLDDRDIVSLKPVDLPPSINPPPFRFRVGYADNYSIQTTGISPLATTRKSYIATPNNVAQSSSGSLQALARPNDPDVITGSIVDALAPLTAVSAAQQIAGRYVGLWGTRRRVYAIEVPFTVGVALEYGDVISVTTNIGDLAGTTNGQIVGYAYRSEDASITLKVLI